MPAVLSALQSGTTPQLPSPLALFEKGLAQIPAVSPGAPGPAAGPSGAGTPATTTTTPPAASTTPTTSPPTGTGTTGPVTCSGSILSALGCPAAGASGGSPGPSGGSGGGLGGLLSYRQPMPSSGPAGAPPSLDAASARLLPPLPPGAPGASRGHRPSRRSGRPAARPRLPGGLGEVPEVTPRDGRSGNQRGRRHGRAGAGLVATLALVTGLSACTTDARLSQITVSAVFPDVNGLVSGAQVQEADIPVGHVTGISLDGSKARVTMVIERGAQVPANVVAALEQTTVLGENFVQLQVPRRPGPLLAEGATIGRTRVVPEVEQLVAAGAQVFGSVSTAQLAQIIAAGGQGFGGEAASLRGLLNSLSDVTAGYAGRTRQITAAVASLDQLGTSLSPHAGADAQALANLSRTVGILAQQSSRFNDLLRALDDVSTQGRSLLEQYYPQIVTQLGALEAVSGQLASHQQDLAGLLQQLPVHNTSVPSAVRNDFVQIFENLIVCGIPGGGENPSPAFTCATHGTGP